MSPERNCLIIIEALVKDLSGILVIVFKVPLLPSSTKMYHMMKPIKVIKDAFQLPIK